MRALFPVLRLFWQADRWRFVAGVLTAIATVLAGIALLGLSGWFITASAMAGVAGMGLTFDFFRPSAGIRFLALVRTASRYGERLVTHDATLAFLVTLRTRLFRHFAALDPRRLGQLRSGEILARITADIDNLDNVYLRLFLPVVTAVLAIVATGLGIGLLDPWLGFLVGSVLLSGLLVALAAGVKLGGRAGRLATFAREALRIRTLDLVRGQVELIFSGRIAAQKAAIGKADARERVAGQDVNLAETTVSTIVFLTSQGALLVALWAGARLVAQDALGVAQLAMILMVVLAASEASGHVARGVAGIGRTVLAAKRIVPVHVSGAHADNAVRDAPAPEGRHALLALRDVSFSWADDREPVLRDVSLSIEPYERLVVTGPSGAGKSTLLSIAAGIIPATSGCVLVKGQDMRTLEESAIRARIGLLPHMSAVFADTVAGNLRLADPSAREEDLWHALAVAELAEHVRSLPDGLSSRLAERGGGFSGGQLRRLALARLFLRRPDVFLLDEPTEGMDEELGIRVLSNLFVARPDAAIVYSSHKPVESLLATRRLVLAGAGFDMGHTDAVPDNVEAGPDSRGGLSRT